MCYTSGDVVLKEQSPHALHLLPILRSLLRCAIYNHAAESGVILLIVRRCRKISRSMHDASRVSCRSSLLLFKCERLRD